MAVYVVTGKLGNGKSLVCVGRIKEYLFKHSRIATNLDLNLKSMFGKNAKNINLIRIPDKPTLFDLEVIGEGYQGEYNEEKFGALVLDECGTWFNSRNWQDKDRKAVNDWFLHARKLGWDVFLIIQDISILDSQAREAIAELLVTCRRLDKIRVPFIAPLIKTLTGFNVSFPRIHRARVTYSDGLLSDVWTYRGNDLFDCYDTRQKFSSSYPHGTHSILTPWHTHGRFAVPMNWKNIMRLTKIHWKRFKSPVALVTGLLLGLCLGVFHNAEQIQRNIVRYELMKKAETENQQPVKPVPQNSTEPVKDAPAKNAAPDTQTRLSAFLSNVRILSSYNINDLRLYTFSSGEPNKYLTSSELSGMGFAIKPLSDCMAELTYNETKTLVRCL